MKVPLRSWVTKWEILLKINILLVCCIILFSVKVGKSQCNNPITTFPVVMGFNGSSSTNWTQNSNDDFDWSFDSNGTGSSGTGPSGPAEGSHYIYTEASNPNYPNKTAIITSPCYALPGGQNANLTFKYHMFSEGGTTMGSLYLEVAVNGGSWNTIWSKTAHQANSWLSQSIDLASYAGDNIQLRFRGVTADSWQSDIAVDDLKIELVIPSEICDNGIDDDLDGKIDCGDEDCSSCSALDCSDGVKVIAQQSATAKGSGSSGVATLSSFYVPEGNNRVVFVAAAFEREHCQGGDDCSNSNTAGVGLGDNFAAPDFVNKSVNATLQLQARISGSGGSVTRYNPLSFPLGDLRFGAQYGFPTPPDPNAAATYFSREIYYFAFYESDIQKALDGSASGNISISLPDVLSPLDAADESIMMAFTLINVKQNPSSIVRSGTNVSIHDLVNNASGYAGNYSISINNLDDGQEPNHPNDGLLLLAVNGVQGYGFNNASGFDRVGYTTINNAITSDFNTLNESDGFTLTGQFRNGPSSGIINNVTVQSQAPSSLQVNGGMLAAFTFESCSEYLNCQPPVDESFDVCSGESINGSVSSNDPLPIDAFNVAYNVETNPGKGSLVLGSNGDFTYNANATASGSDVFEYERCYNVIDDEGVDNLIFNPCGSGRIIDTYVAGIEGASSPSITIPNPNNFEKIIVDVWTESACSSVTIEGVVATATDIIRSNGAIEPEKIYRVELTSISSDGIINIAKSGGCVLSSVAAYVERQQAGGAGSSVAVISNVDLNRDYVNGDDCTNIMVPIGYSDLPRDIEFTIPIHEKDNVRRVEATVTAGPVSEFSFLLLQNTPGSGAAVMNITLNNVPAAVNVANIEVCSPNILGDSFGIGVVSASNNYCQADLTNQCCDIGTAIINFQDISTSINASESSICEGNSTILTTSASNGSGNYSYNWNQGLGSGTNKTVSPTSNTTYIVTITDNVSGCSKTEQITIQVNNNPTAVAGSDQSICNGESVTLSASGTGSGSLSYSWNQGLGNGQSKTFTPSGSSSANVTYNYSVTVTDGNGCEAEDDVNVEVLSLPSPTVTKTDETCGQSDGAIVFTFIDHPNRTNISFSINGGANWIAVNDNASPYVFSGLSSGNYDIRTKWGNDDCEVNLSNVNITNIDGPTVSFAGATEVCQGITTSVLPNTGGTWTSSNTNVATISNSGIIQSVGPGKAVFTFTDNLTLCSTESTDTLMVYSPINVQIDFNGSLCLTDNSQLTADATGGSQNYNYNWSGPNGFSSNLETISIVDDGNYYLTVTDDVGCEATTSGFVYQRYEPFIFTINTEVCEGEDVNLSVNSGSATSYLWSANAGSSTASSVNVTPQPPSSTYQVTVTNDIGCQTSASAIIDVTPKPTTALDGPAAICVGDTTHFLPSSGGVWISTNPGVASINNQGVVIGIANGNSTFIYQDLASNCTSDTTVSIQVTDNTPAMILGSDQYCTGANATLTSNIGNNGTWTSSNPSVATINSATGEINAIAQGSTTITFVPNDPGCFSSGSKSITISNSVSPVISGTDKICQGETTTLLPNSGGTWTSSNTSVATVNASGIVTGQSAGLVYFTFTSTEGCTGTTTSPVEVFNKVSTSLNGPDSLCVGNTTNLFPSSGGIWTSSDNSVATINSSGVVTALSGGATVLSFYENINGCKSDNDITITVFDEVTPSFSGPNTICIGESTQIFPSTGGTWVSDNPSVASITNSGQISAQNSGIARFTFTSLNTGCVSKVSGVLTVNPKPTVTLDGLTDLCVGSTAVISPSSGGTWMSNNPSVASITNQGEIMGLSSGTVSFTFTSGTTGCSSDNSSDVNIVEPIATQFIGPTTVCVGEQTSISPTSGGTWQSSDDNLAIISSSGVITALSPGTVTFTFYDDNGICASGDSESLMINPKPNAIILGPNSICIDATTTLSPSSGGTWVSNNPSIASISQNGLVTGLSEGQATFIFTNSNTGCVSNQSNPITVFDQTPVFIDGDDEICINGTTQLNPNSGGFWTSSNPGVAMVSTSGLVTGLGEGQVNFTFTENSTGCVSDNTLPITVLAKPITNLTGPNGICIGETTTIEPSMGGTWSSNNPNVATITYDGVITGVTQGITKFVFTTVDGCVSDESVSVTVYGKPSIFNPGDDELCIGSTLNLFPSSGGTWTSLNPSIATITNSGLVTGISSGATRFIFQDGNTGCSSDTSNVITIHPAPEVNLNGPNEICIGSTTQFLPAVGGLWFSNDPSVALISNNGIVTGISEGSTTFYFLNLTTNCISNNTIPISIVDKPIVEFTDGTDLCIGDTTYLLPSSGGTWVSNNPMVASINNQGQVISLAQGVARFKYTQIGGCSSNWSGPLTVHPNPSTAINGPSSICIGSTTQLIPNSGGTWTSTMPSIATIDNQGLVTGIEEGSSHFIFTDASTGCMSDGSLSIDVNDGPIINVDGPTTICAGFKTKLSSSQSGLWYSSNEAVATVNNSGDVLGIAPGKTIISFVDAATGCNSGNNSIEITVDKCLNHDFNVTKTDWLVNGYINTNDYTPANTTYGTVKTLLQKPSGSNPTFNITSNGFYSFETDVEGKYLYRISACQSPQTSGCATTLLEITVVSDIYGMNNPVNNLELVSTYANVDEWLPGQTVTIDAVANDRCVNSLGCNLNLLSLNVLEGAANGTVLPDIGGLLTFTPEPEQIGYDTILYEVCNNDIVSICDASYLFVTTKGPNANNSVVASDDYNFTMSGTAISGNVKLNDSDPEGNDIVVIAQGSELNPILINGGEIFIDSNGDYTFTPSDGFVGNTEFIYTICDDHVASKCMDATLHIMVFGDMSITTKVYLEGALMNNGGALSQSGKPLMRDDLRSNPFTNTNSIPMSDPYSGMIGLIDMTSRFSHVGPGLLASNNLITDSLSVFSVVGDDAIVDWVFLELRSKSDSTMVLATRSALVQRDGDVVDLDGSSSVRFNSIGVDSFYLMVKHRNHLGVMSKLVSNQDAVDFTNPSTPVYDFGTNNDHGLDYTGLAMNANVKSGYMALWAGDFDSNGKLKFTNPNDDQNLLFFEILFYLTNITTSANFDFGYGYLQGDFDLNGKAKFTNPNDDKNMLFSQILLYPLNINILDNFNFFIEQIPE